VKVPASLRDLAFQTVAGYGSTLIGFARGVALAALLDPHSLGAMTAVGLVVSYAQYADLGVGLSLSREIPARLGEGRPASADQATWNGAVFRFLVAVVVALGLLLVARFGMANADPSLRFGFMTVAGVVVLQSVWGLGQIVLQARLRFSWAAAVSLSFAAANLAAGIGGAVFWGVRGVFVGQIMASLVGMIVALAATGIPRQRQLSLHEIRQLGRVGLPLATLNFAAVNLVSIDQLMTAALLGQTALGMYAIVMYTGTALYLLPTAIAQVVGPRLVRRYAEHHDIAAIAEHTWVPVEVLAVSLPLLIAGAWVVVPFLIDAFLPAYHSAIGPLRVYVSGLFFLSLNLGVSTTLLALKKHQLNVPILAACIGLNVVVDVAFVSCAGLGLRGIALGSLVTYFVYWMSHTLLVRHFFGVSVVNGVWQNISDGWPGLVLAIFMALTWANGALASVSAPWTVAVLLIGLGSTLVQLWRTRGLSRARRLLGGVEA